VAARAPHGLAVQAGSVHRKCPGERPAACGACKRSWALCRGMRTAWSHRRPTVRLCSLLCAAGGASSSSAGPGDVPVEAARGAGDFDAERELDAAMLPVEVKEQRLSGLLQSLLCGACLGALITLREVGERSTSADMHMQQFPL
jgi:boron transporter